MVATTIEFFFSKVTKKRRNNLRFNQTVLWTSDEDEALNFKEIGQFRRVEFSNAYGVAFFLFSCKQRAEVFDNREVRC